jgi:drug/metabolite transporter (DMT)-like permease
LEKIVTHSHAQALTRNRDMVLPLAIVWLVFGSTYFAISLTVHSMPPLISSGLRFAAAAFIVALFLLLTGRIRVLFVARRQMMTAMISGAIVMGITIGVVVLAEQQVPSALVAITMSLVPVWVVLFRLRASERITRMTLVGVSLGFSGICLAVLGGGFSAQPEEQLSIALWLLAIVGTTILWSYFSWRTPRLNLPKNALVSTTYQMVGAAIALPLAGFVRGEHLVPTEITASALGGWLYLVVASAAGYVAYNWMCANTSASTASSYSYASPVIALGLGVFLAGETLTVVMIIGMLLAVVGVALLTLGESTPRPTRRHLVRPRSRKNTRLAPVRVANRVPVVSS